jgi:hypothetical protein
MNDDIENIFADAAEEPEESTSTFEASVDVGGVDLYDHSAEEAAIAEVEKEDEIPIPEQPEHMDLPLHNNALQADPVGSLKEQAERSFTGTFDVGKVVVTPEERTEFVRSALHDTEMIFDVELEGLATTIRVAIPPETFTTSAAAAATAWGRDGFNDKDSDLQWLLSFQQMHAWFMVREIGGVPTSWSDAFCDGVPKFSSLRETLKNPDNFETFFIMTPARWRMIVEAMRIAEFKYKLCTEAWQDRSFFTSAGTA